MVDIISLLISLDSTLLNTFIYKGGKPPLSRLRTPNTAKKTRSIRHTPKKQCDTVSVKSAPAESAPKGTLSTTVVSSSTTASAQSVPLLDAEPSPYHDFAKDINNQAKINRGVRSSAIGDLRR